jgi:NAD+ kinase
MSSGTFSVLIQVRVPFIAYIG